MCETGILQYSFTADDRGYVLVWQWNTITGTRIIKQDIGWNLMYHIQMNCLHLHIFIPDYSLAIEYNGEQHFLNVDMYLDTPVWSLTYVALMNCLPCSNETTVNK